MKDPEIEEIDAARRRLGTALQGRRSAAGLNPLDWRGWVARYPLGSALGAAAVGFLLAQPGRGQRDGSPGTFLGDLLRGSLVNVLPHLLRIFL